MNTLSEVLGIPTISALGRVIKIKRFSLYVRICVIFDDCVCVCLCLCLEMCVCGCVSGCMYARAFYKKNALI
jgi:hypothetical protein